MLEHRIKFLLNCFQMFINLNNLFVTVDALDSDLVLFVLYNVI